MVNKIPRWGWVNAKPNECLILLRGGKVRSVQQGGAVFKWPNETVARIDTSVRRLQFTADQVTQEKTGVAVTGLAVFRVVQPELAFRMIDLDDPEIIAGILTEMFVGATRRLVANLTLDDCLTRRKDALAAELMTEVAPVVEGRGQTDDDTDAGWGVVIDTIEIQDVRVLSAEVFERLQAPYREKLALEAMRAEDEVKCESANLQRVATERAEQNRRQLMELEEARLEAERARSRVNMAHDAGLMQEKVVRQAERDELEAEASATRAKMAAKAKGEVERMAAESEVEVAKLAAEAQKIRGEVEAEVLTWIRRAKDTVSEARLTEIALTETLPKVAAAFADSFDTAVVTGGDMGFLSAGMGQVLGTLEAFGVRLPGPEDP